MSKAKIVLAAGGVIGLATVAVLLTQTKAEEEEEEGNDLYASFLGFRLNRVNGDGKTIRQSTVETQKDYQFHPQIRVIPDVDGDVTIKWSWNNKFPDDTQASIAENITNIFTGLKAGQAVILELIDNRYGVPGGGEGLRDTDRAGAVAIGDKDFVGLGILDNNWHNFRSDITVEVTSPSGVTKPANGSLSEAFKYKYDGLFPHCPMSDEEVEALPTNNDVFTAVEQGCATVEQCVTWFVNRGNPEGTSRFACREFAP